MGFVRSNSISCLHFPGLGCHPASAVLGLRTPFPLLASDLFPELRPFPSSCTRGHTCRLPSLTRTVGFLLTFSLSSPLPYFFPALQFSGLRNLWLQIYRTANIQISLHTCQGLRIERFSSSPTRSLEPPQSVAGPGISAQIEEGPAPALHHTLPPREIKSKWRTGPCRGKFPRIRPWPLYWNGLDFTRALVQGACASLSPLCHRPSPLGRELPPPSTGDSWRHLSVTGGRCRTAGLACTPVTLRLPFPEARARPDTTSDMSSVLHSPSACTRPFLREPGGELGPAHTRFRERVAVFGTSVSWLLAPG